MEEREISESDRHMHERKLGKFVRRAPVPDGVTAENIGAEYAKEIVTVEGDASQGDQPRGATENTGGLKEGLRVSVAEGSIAVRPSPLGTLKRVI